MKTTQRVTAICTCALLVLSGCSDEATTNTASITPPSAPSSITSTAGHPAEDKPSIIGKWILNIDTPRGIQHPTLTIFETNGALSGTYESFRGPLDITSVTAEGNQFSFPLTITVPIGDIEVTYTGTVDGDQMTGLVRNPRGEVPFSGQRTSS